MKKRFLSLLLVLAMALGMIPSAIFPASAASTPEEALGEINIYNSGVTLDYLCVNGRVKEQPYDYYLYTNSKGEQVEIPVYCVNPTIYGVPETVGPGQSIKYIANEKSKDPKVMGIVANGYPTKTLAELGVNSKYEAWYATKIALWCYLLSSWDISALSVNPNCSDQAAAQRVLAAVKKAYGDSYLPNYKLDKDEIKSKYGVDSSLYASAYAEVPMISAQVDQLVIFKAKNASSKKKILTAVKKYQKDLKADTMQYPMNSLKIQGSKVYANGNYVCFFMLGGSVSKSIEESGSDAKIIKAHQQLNKKAVNTVKNKLK